MDHTTSRGLFRVHARTPLLCGMTALLAAATLTACANTPAMKDLQARQQTLRAQAHETAKPAPRVTVDAGNYVAMDPVEYTRPDNAVSIRAHGIPVASAVRQILPRGWSLTFAQGVKPSTKISVDIQHMARKSALRHVAMAAGGVVVIHADQRQVIIAKKATYFYHVPAGLLGNTQAGFRVASSTTVSGNGSSGGSMGGGGMGAGGMGGGSSGGSNSGNGSQFQISGQSPQSSFVKALQKLVGTGGSVVGDPSTGQLAITAGSGGLARADTYIRYYVAKASTEIDIHAAILEVSLDGSMATGIKWDKVFSASSLSLGLTAPIPSMASLLTSNGNSSSFSVLHTGASLNSVIQALQTVGNVRVLTQPWLTTSNGLPATINSGTQVPYVGQLNNTISGGNGQFSQTGASLSYATNGVSLSFIPQLVGNNQIQMAVVPSLSSIQSFQQFKVDGGTLEGPVLQQRQAYVKMLIKPDETTILGGSITHSAKTQSNGIPFLSTIPGLGAAFGNYGASKNRTQLVILVRAHLTHHDIGDPLVGASL